jgi:LacI family transcriptional regulator
MTASRQVLLMLGCSRASERGLLRGIVRYSRFHDPWIFYWEPPFYRKPPYHSLPKHPRTPASVAGILPAIRGRDALDTRGIDGIVAFAASRAQIEAFLPPDFPSVILPIEEKIPGRCSIVEEACTVGRMAAEHFLDRGFTRFAFCGFDHMYWSRVRQEGFVQRIAEAGFTVHLYEPGRHCGLMIADCGLAAGDDSNPQSEIRNPKSRLAAGLQPAPSGRVPWEAEQAFVAEWLRSLPKPIGLMACNDDRAQQVLEANKAAGARVPEEIAILGVDDDEMICELTHPPMSSIVLNVEEAGYEAAAQLDRQMKGKKPSINEIYLRPTHVHTRQSTDVLAVEDPVVAEALRFIRTHAGDVLSVRDVVEAASTSRRLLERHFRQAVGLSIYHEIQRAHIERACRMLAETNWSLADVATRCGFANAVHFSVAFKRQMKLTPEQHRRRTARPRPEDGSRRTEDGQCRKIEIQRREIE